MKQRWLSGGGEGASEVDEPGKLRSLAPLLEPKQTGPSWSGFRCSSLDNELHLSEPNLTVYLVSPRISISGTFL